MSGFLTPGMFFRGLIELHDSETPPSLDVYTVQKDCIRFEDT